MSTRKNTKTIISAIMLVCVLGLVGCAAPAEEAETPASEAEAVVAGPVRFTDDLGNEVTIENPQRVVACMGSFADMWQLAGGTLVGASTDSFADYGVDRETVAAIGDFSKPDMEAILACDPDFVIMTSAAGGRGGVNAQLEMREALEASGITTAYFEVTTFEDYLRMFGTLCDITGRPDLFEQNGTKVAADIESTIAKGAVSADKQVTAAILTTFSQGIRVQNSHGMTGAMVAQMGVSNIADTNPSLLKDFSMESLIEINPDVIYILPMGNDAASADANLKAATTDNPAWATLSAVEAGHVVVLDPTYFMYKPNENWATSYSILADSLKDFK